MRATSNATHASHSRLRGSVRNQAIGASIAEPLPARNNFCVSTVDPTLANFLFDAADQASAYRHSTNEATAPSMPCAVGLVESIRQYSSSACRSWRPRGAAARSCRRHELLDVVDGGFATVPHRYSAAITRESVHCAAVWMSRSRQFFENFLRRPASVPSRRPVVNPARPGREQR